MYTNYLYRNNLYKKYEGLSRIIFETSEKVAEAPERHFPLSRTTISLKGEKVPLLIYIRNVIGWTEIENSLLQEELRIRVVDNTYSCSC